MFSIFASLFRSQKTQLELFQEEAMPHLDALFGKAFFLTKNREDAEDLVQETMLKAIKKFEQYRLGTNCKAWLFTILQRTFYNQYRKQKKIVFIDESKQRSLEELVTASGANKYEYSFDHLDELIQQLFDDEISRALLNLPDKYKEVILLVDVYGFSYRETAEILDCPGGTVMSRLSRGRKSLRKKLKKEAVQMGINKKIVR